MCICLWVEYCCECNKPHCPHKQPSHPHHHVQDTLWQIDHKAWQYCPAFIRVLDSVRQEIQNAMPNNSSSVSNNHRGTSSSSRQGDNAPVMGHSRYFRDSTDPRHNGQLPLCGDIRYSAWRIVKTCDYCRDYWIGRSMENAF